MPESGVEIVWGALERALRKVDYSELWLQFRPRGSKDVFDAVEDAVQAANQAVEDAGWGDDVFTEGASDSDAGPVARMSRVGPEEGVRAWLDAFARHLEARGLSGKVTAAYRTDDLTLINEQERDGIWHVPAGLTAQITEAGTRWGRFNGADVYLLRSIHQIRTKNPDVGQALADATMKFGQARVNYLRSEPRRKVSMSLSNQGRVCYAVMDDTASWQDRLAQVTQAMAAFPEETDLAFVQYSNASTTTWSDLATVRPVLPHVRESHVRYNRHLYTRYVRDAHGVQLLTDAHLANANDLSDWSIEPLGEGKHLVQARDLAPWYATIDPDPDTLVKARADFGGMILTPEIIAANPPPWDPTIPVPGWV